MTSWVSSFKLCWNYELDLVVVWKMAVIRFVVTKYEQLRKMSVSVITIEWDLLFHKTKMCYFASILFGRVFLKKMPPLSFRALANIVNQHRKPAESPLFDYVNEMKSDKQWQAKSSGFVSRWKQFLSLKNSCSFRICSFLNRLNLDTTVH